MDTPEAGWIHISADDKATYPAVDQVVLGRLQHCSTKRIVEARLVHVVEDDVAWRTADDRSEVSYDWDVVAWHTLPPDAVNK